MSTEQMDLGEAPRLMISKVVCENFKSYAGTKVLGPFHKCFSSVVGPNGSGKSNMIDAMLFVFGYRAAKIRSKKVSVLIHKSDQHRDYRHCSVSVHFQKILDLPDSDQFSVVPDSEFVVSRTAYADNSSIYQLNGKRMQFKEIAALLRESGIDLDHNRFLILQGEVEQIAMMKPRGQNEGDDGMLEFLEDVIGSSRLKAPIEELGKKVDLLNDARGDKVNRVKAVEHEKNDLEAAKTEAEEYLSLQADIAKKQCILYQKYIMECGRIERQAESKKDELEEQIVPLKDQLKLLKEEAKEREKDLNKRIKLHEKLLEEIEGCRTALTSCEQRDVSARQELKNAKANLKKIEKNLEKEKEKLKGLEEAPDKCQKDIEEATDQIEVLESRKEIEEKKLSEVLSSLRTATQGLQEEKEGYELELISLNQRVNESKAKVDMAQAELDLFNERSSSLQSQLDEAREKLTRTKDQMKASKEGVSRLNKDIPLRKKQVADSEEELKSLSAAEGKLTKQVKHLRSQAEEGKLSLDAFKSRSKVLQSLLQQRDSGELPGVCGRLGDLGTIDQRYDIAISTACAALDHIVVDTMETAVKCVSYLKHNGLGSATFIGLDKVDHLRGVADKGVQVSEDVPRLYDLVKPKDDKYRPAFYFALRNTLVASDLEQATRIGMKGRIRHRVVTLSGQLIDSSGTMSGGGNRVSKGRMSSKTSSDVSPQQVEEVKKRLQDNERALTDCCERRTSTEDRLKQLKRDVSEMEKELRKYEVNAQLLVDQEEAIRNRIVELQKMLCGFTPLSEALDPILSTKLDKKVAVLQSVKRIQHIVAGGRQLCLTGSLRATGFTLEFDEEKSLFVCAPENVCDGGVEEDDHISEEGLSEEVVSKETIPVDTVSMEMCDQIQQLSVEEADVDSQDLSALRLPVDENIQELKAQKDRLARELETRAEAQKRVKEFISTHAVVEGDMKRFICPKYLIPDTNGFIDHLENIKQLVECGYFVITIPLTVLDELEGLAKGPSTKDNGKQKSCSTSEEGARMALSAVKGWFAAKSNSVKMATLKGELMTSLGYSSIERTTTSATNDDFILASCTSLHERTVRMHEEDIRISVVLLTDDRNLRVKAHAAGLPVRDFKAFIMWTKPLL